MKLRGLVSDVIARKWQGTVGIQIPCSSLPCCVPPQQESQFAQKILIPLFGFVNYLCFYFLKLGAVVEINLWDLQYACKFLFMPLFREADYLLLKMMHWWKCERKITVWHYLLRIRENNKKIYLFKPFFRKDKIIIPVFHEILFPWLCKSTTIDWLHSQSWKFLKFKIWFQPVRETQHLW